MADGDIDTGADAGAPNDAPQLTEVEQLASEMGWEPQSNYNGDPAKWRPATDWIKSTNAQNRNLRKEVNGLRSSIERIVDATDKQVKREVERRAAEIEAQFSAAVEAQDAKGAADAARAMRELEAESRPAPAGNVEEQFARDNPWYGTDEDATAYAISISQREANKGVNDPAKQLATVVAAVKKRFPEHFGSEQREEPKPQPSLNTPGRPLAPRKTQGFGDMPEAARLAANRFYEAAKMRGTAPERKEYEAKYAADYFGEQAA